MWPKSDYYDGSIESYRCQPIGYSVNQIKSMYLKDFENLYGITPSQALKNINEISNNFEYSFTHIKLNQNN